MTMNEQKINIGIDYTNARWQTIIGYNVPESKKDGTTRIGSEHIFLEIGLNGTVRIHGSIDINLSSQAVLKGLEFIYCITKEKLYNMNGVIQYIKTYNLQRNYSCNSGPCCVITIGYQVPESEKDGTIRIGVKNVFLEIGLDGTVCVHGLTDIDPITQAVLQNIENHIVSERLLNQDIVVTH